MWMQMQIQINTNAIANANANADADVAAVVDVDVPSSESLKRKQQFSNDWKRISVKVEQVRILSRRRYLARWQHPPNPLRL